MAGWSCYAAAMLRAEAAAALVLPSKVEVLIKVKSQSGKSCIPEVQ